MDKESQRKVSKRLSFVLRHDPDSIGIELDQAGWVEIDTLLVQLAKHAFRLSLDDLQTVVQQNDKQRFSISEDGLCIRANQGHSISIDLGYEPAPPPEFLYHGTVSKFIDEILAGGLVKKDRHHVHLTESIDTATKVGQRRGKPVLLKIDAGKMAKDGIEFLVTQNQVWLVDHVPVRYIEVI